MEDINNGTAPLKVTINGVDYDPAEAQELIETGRHTREMEKKFNTSIDKVWPAYGQSQTTLTEIQKQKEALEKQVEEFKKKQEEGTDTPKDLIKAKEAARALGIPLREDLEKEGYIRKDDLDKYLTERDEQKKQVDKVLAEADKLVTEIDGSDGRPAFNKKAVLAYASTYGFSDLKEAYEDMHTDKIKAWKDAQIEAERAKSLRTMGGGDKKNPKAPRVTDDNLKEMLNETLYGGHNEEE